jgi:hypothetical protein
MLETTIQLMADGVINLGVQVTHSYEIFPLSYNSVTVKLLNVRILLLYNPYVGLIEPM